MNYSTSKQQALTAFLSQFVTDNKLEKIERVLPWRTRYLTVVLEDISEAQNASAVIRTCECYGIQDLHIIDNRRRFRTKKAVVQGASKWIDIHRYREGSNNTADCMNALRAAGYRLVATAIVDAAQDLETLELDQKTALLFGSENRGLSPAALAEADALMKLPMFGFTQSLNLSVSTAISIAQLVGRLHHSNIEWQLSEEESAALRLEWLKKAIGKKTRVEALMRRFQQLEAAGDFKSGS